MARAYKSEYNLRKSFIVKAGNDYPIECVKSLRFWARFTPTTYEDLSKNNLTGSYSGNITSTKNSVASGEVLPIGIFPGDPAYAEVSGSPLLSFSSAESGEAPSAGSDQPFSISVWVKVDNLDAAHYIVTKKTVSPSDDTSTGTEYYIAINASGVLMARLSDKTQTSNSNPGASSAAGAILAQRWHHILVTYDGRGTTDADDGINIYINGENGVDSRTGTQSNYTGMCPNSQHPLFIGVYYQGSNELEGQISELAMWSRCLTPGQVKAVYNATIRETTYRIGTGFLNLPPKVTTRQRDNATGSYPTIARTSGVSGSLGNSPSVFDDTRVVIFQKLTSTGSASDPLGRWGGPITSSNSFSDVRYPTALDTFNHNRYYRNWVVTPNTSASFGDSTIYSGSSGSIGPFLSTQGLKFSIDQGLSLSPFDDTAVFLGETSFYMTGTSPSIYPGFSSPLRDKFQIKIALGSSTGSFACRYNGNEMEYDGTAERDNGPTTVDADGDLLYPPNDNDFGYASNFTGFLYYNFDTARWNDVGHTELGGATGGNAFYSMWYLDSGSDGDVNPKFIAPGPSKPAGHPGFGGFMQHTYKSYQFGMSSHMGHYATDYSDLMQYGYDKIGAATMSGRAPFAPAYYATSSNTLKMSDYLAAPFLLEKAVIEIPVVIRRKDGPLSGNTAEKFRGANRDIDNYTFFMYRQTKDDSSMIDALTGRPVGHGIAEPRFKEQIAKSSKRYLICSGCVAVYNEKVFTPSINTQISASGLPHSPSVSINLSYPISSSLASEIQRNPKSTYYTASLRIEMTPAVPTGRYSAASRFPTRLARYSNAHYDSPGPGLVGSVLIQDFWPGGTTPVSGALQPASHPNNPQSNFKGTGAKALPPSFAFVTTFNPIWPLGTQITDPVRVERRPGYNDQTLGAFRNPAMTSLGGGTRPITNDFGYRFNYEKILPFTDTLGAIANQQLPSTFASGSTSSTPSPYMLFPEDELIIGLDAGISITEVSGVIPSALGDMATAAGAAIAQAGYINNDEICNISGSYMKIRTGRATLTLFGSEVREDQERLFELNQPLTSDAIHEALHFDNPVLDQFMIEDRSMYSGSYTDDMNMGFILARSGTVDGGWTDSYNIPFTMPRGRHGVKLGGMGNDRRKISDFFFNPIISPGLSVPVLSLPPRMDPNGLRFWNNNLIFTYRSSRQLRTVTLLDFSERYFDTIMPNIGDYCSRSGLTVYSMHGIPAVYSDLNGAKAKYVESSSATDWNTYAWPYATEVPREVVQNVHLFGRIVGDPNSTPIPARNTTNANSALEPLGGGEWLSTSSMINTVLDPIAVKAILFRKGYEIGLGSGQIYGPISDSYNRYVRIRHGGADLPNFGSFVNSAGSAHGYGYGVQDVRPHFSKAIFRADRYGQFRDMMEQRQYAKFFESPGDSKQIGKDGYGEGTGVVTDFFVDSSNGMTLVNPYSTNSSNMDNESSSSMPFVDNTANNRAEGETFSTVDLGGLLNCVAEGTLILTNAGNIPVEDVTLDHKIFSYNFEKKDFGYFDIKNCFNGSKDIMYDIETECGFKLRCTGDHPIMSPSRKDCELLASETAVGDPVWVAREGELIIDKISEVSQVEETCAVYNFTVDHVHTYVSNGILSHNMGGMTFGGGMLGGMMATIIPSVTAPGLSEGARPKGGGGYTGGVISTDGTLYDAITLI